MSRKQAGFSLVELMIVVAIVGVLAAIAIPNFVSMQLRAKRAELPGNIHGIRVVELAYDASYDEYLELPLAPRVDNDLDKTAVAWVTSGDEWKTVGWSPDGLVRGNYQVGLSSVDHPGIEFLITARADLDNDDALTEYTASENDAATLTPSRINYY